MCLQLQADLDDVKWSNAEPERTVHGQKSMRSTNELQEIFTVRLGQLWRRPAQLVSGNPGDHAVSNGNLGSREDGMQNEQTSSFRCSFLVDIQIWIRDVQ